MSSEQKSNLHKIMKTNLTEVQKARIERNRLKALNLKAAKLVANHPASGSGIKQFNSKTASDNIIKIKNTKYVDSGAGFLIEQEATVTSSTTGNDQLASYKAAKVPKVDTLQLPITYYECLECGGDFADSYLLKNFGYYTCDACHKHDSIHSLITKTEAKVKYLLKDCDLEKRPPPLRFISRKNPHSMGGGDMKLYLQLQVEQRAIEVWGSMEELERQFELREKKNRVAKIRKYNRRMRELRMAMRSSLYTKQPFTAHDHDFGEETYHPENDTYSHICKTCTFKEVFEKI